MKEKLISRGYGKNKVKKEVREGLEMERAEALKRTERSQEDERINFVMTHSAYLPNVNQILRRHRHYLQEDRLKCYMKDVPRLGLRRGKNLVDLIVNAKEKKKSSYSEACGEKCALCSSMKKADRVKGKGNKEYYIRGRMNCKTVGLLYGMWCEQCQRIVYVGKSKNGLQERFYGHWSDLRSADVEKPAYHFKRQGHKDEDMKVVALEEVPGRDDIYRIQRERWWMEKMGTLMEENKRW